MAKNNDDNEDVKNETQDDVDDRKCAGRRFGKPQTLYERRNGEDHRKEQNAAPKTDRVHANDDDSAPENAKSVITEAAGFSIGIKDQRRQQKQKEQEESVAGGDRVKLSLIFVRHFSVDPDLMTQPW